MNKFTPHTGGHLPKLDDFIWMQEAYLEGFGALLSSLIPDDTGCILSGCNLTIAGNDYEMEEGFVFYGNEVFKVNASSGSFNDGKIPCFELLITYGPDDPVEYLDKELKNVHEVREMELVFFPLENDFPYDDETRLDVLLKELLDLTEVNDRLDITEEEIQELKQVTEDLESRVEQTEVDITNLEILGTDHQERLARAEEDISNIESSGAENVQRIGDAEDDIEALNDLTANHEGRIDQCEIDLTNLEGLGTEHEERLDALENNTVPIGTIVMTDEVSDFDFSTGLGFANWQGWALCNGANGTPDLRGRFIAGLNLDDPDYESVDSTGGTSNVQLEEEDIPRHYHGYDKVGDHGVGRNLSGSGNDAWEKVEQDRVSTSSFGGEYFPAIDTREYDTNGSPDFDSPDYNPNYGNVIAGELIPAYYATRAHENRPPYYVLAYVKKVS